jgi:hypothetical protein
MDMVIFTGRVTTHELRTERPAEYARLGREGRLDALRAHPGSERVRRAGRVAGTAAVSLGLALAALILYALMT